MMGNGNTISNSTKLSEHKRSESVIALEDINVDNRCECLICRRGRRFMSVIKTLSEVDQQFLREVHDQLLDAEANVELLEYDRDRYRQSTI